MEVSGSFGIPEISPNQLLSGLSLPITSTPPYFLWKETPPSSLASSTPRPPLQASLFPSGPSTPHGPWNFRLPAPSGARRASGTHKSNQLSSLEICSQSSSRAKQVVKVISTNTGRKSSPHTEQVSLNLPNLPETQIG